MEILTDRLAEFISTAKYEKLPPKIRAIAKERILDILSAAFAGSVLWEHNQGIIETLNEMGVFGNSVIIGKHEKTSFWGAAFINTAYAHSVELDDGHKNAGVHAGAAVVPTALSIGERFNANGGKVLTAVTVGYEIAYRFAANMCPELINNCFHPSAVCDTMASAATAAVILNLSKEECANALALSALSAAGLMEVTYSGQSSKGAMVGQAAVSGIRAAFMAKHGLKGPENAFGGKSGLLKAMSSHADISKMLESLGKDFLIADTYVKLYPTCRHTHAPIEGIAALRREHNFLPSDIASIKIGTFPIAYDLTGKPGIPETPQQARFSAAYCTCVSLLTGTFGVDDLKEENIALIERQKITKLVSVYIDNEVSAEFPKKRGAKIRVILKNGSVYEDTIYKLKGSPDFPISFDDLKNKLFDTACLCFDHIRIDQIAEELKHLEIIPNINCFAELLSN